MVTRKENTFCLFPFATKRREMQIFVEQQNCFCCFNLFGIMKKALLSGLNRIYY
jgi:hypothetical protein